MHSQRGRAALGREGERYVARKLESSGFQILGRNVRVGRLEIDLVAARDDLVVFVEVRTRRAGSLVHPAATFDAEKRARIRRAAAIWLGTSGLHPKTIRFDAAAVVAASRDAPARMHYYANAF